MTDVETKDDKQWPRKVSAVVISYFTGPVLVRCLKSLAVQEELGEIILIDNGNPADEIDRLVRRASCGDITTVISGHGNIGFAAACNKGVSAAGYEIILLLNPDAEMPPDGLGKMLDDAETLTGPWLMGAKLVGIDGKEQQGSRRGVLTPLSAILEASQLYRILPNGNKRRFNQHAAPSPQRLTDIPTLSGACLMTTRQSYLAIHGMDEGYFLHVEDIDFCRRFAAAGGRVLFNPNVDVTHHKGSSRANSARVERLKTQSMIRYFRKHFGDVYPAPIIFVLSALLWIFYGLRRLAMALKNSVRFMRFFFAHGFAGARRARRIHATRLSR